MPRSSYIQGSDKDFSAQFLTFASVAALGMAADGSYDPAQLQAVADKLDELLAATLR